MQIKKHFQTFALLGGVIAVLFEWLAVFLFYITLPADFGGDHPLSYFASLTETRYIFATCLSIAAICFWVFFKWHLSKKFKTPIELFTISMFAYLVLASAPFDPNNFLSHIFHQIVALIFTVTFILSMFLMGKNNKEMFIKIFSLSLATLAGVLTITMFVLADMSHFFILELAVGFICQIWTIGITYYTYKIKKS